MAKTIALIFVRPNGYGLLVAEENFQQYQLLHQKAVTAYKKAFVVLEKISGKPVKVSYEIIKQQLIPAEAKGQPANRIILIRDDKTNLLLENETFSYYQEHHFKGLDLLQEKSAITGQLVQVTIS